VCLEGPTPRLPACLHELLEGVYIKPRHHSRHHRHAREAGHATGGRAAHLVDADERLIYRRGLGLMVLVTSQLLTEGRSRTDLDDSYSDNAPLSSR